MDGGIIRESCRGLVDVIEKCVEHGREQGVSQLIGLRENIQENPMIFMGKSMVSG